MSAILAAELRTLIDGRIRETLGALSATTVRGRVDQVSDGYASVFLEGAPTPSPGITYGSPRPATGDDVLVSVGPTQGRRYIALNITQGDGAAPSGGGGPLPAGTVTDDQLAAAIASHGTSGHLVTYTTPSTLDTDAGNWTRVATGNIVARWGEVVAQVLIGGGGGSTAAWTRGMLRFRVRQQSDFGTAPLVRIELVDAQDTVAADFRLRLATSAAPSSFQLYARVTRAYERMTFTPLDSWSYNGQLVWTGCDPWVTTVPVGEALYTAVAV